jgi:hypothetical protein
MKPGCGLCSGIQAQIKAAEGDINEMKATEKSIFGKIEDIRKEIAKMPSTKTLLAIIGIIVTIFGTIATIGYLAHQSRMAGLEATTTSLQKQINGQYATIGARLQGIESFSKKPEAAKTAIKK